MLVSNKLFSKKTFNLFLEEISYEIKDYYGKTYSINSLIKMLKNKNKKFQVLGDFLLVNKEWLF